MPPRNPWEALSDPTRREILMLLREGSRNAGEIAGQFSISKPSISHHLSILREAGLVECQKSGQHIFYTLSTEAFAPLRQFLELVSDIAPCASTEAHSPSQETSSSHNPDPTSPQKKEKSRSTVPVYLY